jgi:hypothetical protein
MIIGLNIVLADALCEEQNCHERVILEVEVEVEVGIWNHIAESDTFCSLNVVMLCLECVSLCLCCIYLIHFGHH